MDPCRGDRSVASCFANFNCCSSPNRWKSDEACIAEVCPCNGVRDFKVLRSVGRGVVGSEKNGSLGSIKTGLKASPGTKAAGKVSDVDLNSS